MMAEDGLVFAYDWTHLDTARYLTIAMLCLFGLMGIVGNLLVLYVYVRKRDSLISTFFILVLAAVDFVTCLVIIPWTIYLEYVDFIITDDIQCKVYQFLVSSNVPFSAFIMVAIAIDRYFCICHPFLQAITLVRAQVIVCVMAMYAAALGSLVACMYSVYHVFDHYIETNNRTTDDSSYSVNSAFGNTTQFVWYRCQQSTAIFSYQFIIYYHKYHVGQFILCLLCIIGLYSLIYLKVYSRRSRRLQQSMSQSVPLVQRNAPTCTQDTDVTTLHNGDSKRLKTPPSLSESPGHINNTENGSSDEIPKDALDIPPQDATTKDSEGDQEKDCLKKRRGDVPAAENNNRIQRRCSRRDRVRLANIRTAVMLSVVTIVFVVTYAPAFLMSCLNINHTGYVHLAYYVYFANNVANPVIYSFMNKNFRDDLKQLFYRRHH